MTHYRGMVKMQEVSFWETLMGEMIDLPAEDFCAVHKLLQATTFTVPPSKRGGKSATYICLLENETINQ